MNILITDTKESILSSLASSTIGAAHFVHRYLTEFSVWLLLVSSLPNVLDLGWRSVRLILLDLWSIWENQFSFFRDDEFWLNIAPAFVLLRRIYEPLPPTILITGDPDLSVFVIDCRLKAGYVIKSIIPPKTVQTVLPRATYIAAKSHRTKCYKFALNSHKSLCEKRLSL